MPTLPSWPTMGISTWLGCMESDSLPAHPVPSPQLHLRPKPPASPSPTLPHLELVFWPFAFPHLFSPGSSSAFTACGPLDLPQSASAQSSHIFLDSLTRSFDNTSPPLATFNIEPGCLQSEIYRLRSHQCPWPRLARLLVSGRPWGDESHFLPNAESHFVLQFG